MAILSRYRVPSILLAFLLFISISISSAEIRFTELRSDTRSIVPIDEFGFARYGRLELNVSSIVLSNPNADHSKVGFFLCTRETWLLAVQQLANAEIGCPLQSRYVRVIHKFYPVTNGASSFNAEYWEPKSIQFRLVFANCFPDLRVSMKVRSAMYNLEGKGRARDYLSAGKTILPRVYFLLSLVYFGLAIFWWWILHKNNSTVYKIHFLMFAVLVLKTLNLLCEAEVKLLIKKTGNAHGWDVLIYIFNFLMGISLFTLIVLIGTGWSFLKQYLQNREKKVLMIVISLQVVSNIEQVVIDGTRPFGQDWAAWREIFPLLDLICCCAVLFPIVWSIKSLGKAARTDGKAAVNLTLFKHYCIVVICYLYFTRVAVYGLVTVTSYRNLWMSIVASEVATLAFYLFIGYKFRPEVDSAYFAIDGNEEEAAVEQLKHEDEQY